MFALVTEMLFQVCTKNQEEADKKCWEKTPGQGSGPR